MLAAPQLTILPSNSENLPRRCADSPVKWRAALVPMAQSVQLFLDPTIKAASGSWQPPGLIPERVREFGRFPNTALWQPGDLLLFSAIRPSLASRAIVRTQTKGGYEAPHHVAVYVGHNFLCEAVLRGVRYGPIYTYVGSHLIRVRRDPSLSNTERYELAIRSIARLKENYSVNRLPLLVFYGMAGFWTRTRLRSDTPTVICSQVFADAHSLTTRRLVVQTEANLVVPADLSMTDVLTDVATNWLSF